MNIKDKIREALKNQTTGLVSAEIRERAGIKEAKACNLALAQMKASGEILPHAGDSPKKTRYTLNPDHVQDAAGAAGGGRRTTAKKKAKKKPGRKARATRTPAAPPAVAPMFVPALSADHELVLVAEGLAPQIFTPEQTVAIATLLGANFR